MLTKEKANEWLKSVTGKKIRLDYWSEGTYIIPTGKWKNTSDKGSFYWAFWGINENDEKDWCVCNGLEETSHSNNWVLVETFEDYLEMYYDD